MKVIDYKKIEDNLRRLLLDNELCVVLKNDAYGFGMERILDICLRLNIREFAVNTIEEAIELRKLCSDTIILFGNSSDYTLVLRQYNIIPTASSIDEIDLYTKEKIYFALEVDSGMNRFGIKNLSEDILDNEYLIYIYTHFYKDIDLNKKLIDRLVYYKDIYNKKVNFGGSLIYGKTNEVLRAGKIIYENATSFYGKVLMIKEVSKGETIGYEGLYKTSEDIRIAILDVGYYNGIRVFFDGEVYCHNNKYKVIGRVCMNHTFIVIDDKINVGDYAEFYGDNININEFLYHNKMTEYESFLFIK